MRFRAVVAAVILAGIAPGAHPSATTGGRASSAQFRSGVHVRYVANAGMLVSVDGGRFLIDAPIRDGIPPYPTSPPEERARLEAASAPYHEVDAVLVTHWHDDHFNVEAIAAHMRRNRRALLVSSPQVADLLRAAAPDLPGERVRAVLPAPGTSQEIRAGGVAVRVLRIRHNPSRRFPEQHVGFMIGNSTHVLHVGDADPKPDNFAVMRGLPKVGLALLPYWYITSAASRQFVAESIAPERIVAMHLPVREAAEVAAAIEGTGGEIVLPPAPGAPIVWK